MYYIYQIYNDVTQRRYIGLTKDYKERERTHFSLMRSGKHKSENIITDVIKYGLEHFSFQIIDIAETKEEGLKKENFYIHKYNTYCAEFGYNGYDSRFYRGKKRPSAPNSELTCAIYNQGYDLHFLASYLHIKYRYLICKLNHPEMFSQEEFATINELISMKRWQRQEQERLKERRLGVWQSELHREIGCFNTSRNTEV